MKSIFIQGDETCQKPEDVTHDFAQECAYYAHKLVSEALESGILIAQHPVSVQHTPEPCPSNSDCIPLEFQEDKSSQNPESLLQVESGNLIAQHPFSVQHTSESCLSNSDSIPVEFLEDKNSQNPESFTQVENSSNRKHKFKFMKKLKCSPKQKCVVQ